MITIQMQNEQYISFEVITGQLWYARRPKISPKFHEDMLVLGLLQNQHYVVIIDSKFQLIHSSTIPLSCKTEYYPTVTFQNRNHALLFKLAMDDCVEISTLSA